MPGESGEPTVTTLVWFYFFPREAAGASSARHSPRPLMFRWLHTIQNSRISRGEIAEVCVNCAVAPAKARSHNHRAQWLVEVVE